MRKKSIKLPRRDGMVAEYLLNGDARDTSGNNYHGTASNVTYSKTDRGYQTLRGFFAGGGTSSMIVNSGFPALTSSFTIQLLIANANLSQSGTYVYEKGHSGAGNQHAIIYGYVSNSYEFFSSVFRGGTIVCPDTKQHLITYTYDGSTFSAYLDANLVSSVTASFSLNYVNGAFVYGQTNGYGGGTSHFGQSLRFFNRALSENEIRDWYEESLRYLGGSSLYGLMDGCVAKFDTLDGNVLSDIVGGVSVTKNSGSSATDNLGGTRAITNPNYSWSSVTYKTGYTFEDSGSGWGIQTNPTGLSATGVNRTTTLREVFLFNRTLSTDERTALENLCKVSYVLPFSENGVSARGSIPEELRENCVLFIPGEVSGTTLFDASGNGNHGTLVNSPTLTRGGLHGYEGVSFNGSNQYASLGNVLSLQNSLTISVSVYITNMSQSYVRILAKTFSNFSSGSQWVLGVANDKVYFGLFHSGSTQTYFDTAGPIPNGRWCRITVRWDGSTMKCFINGIDTGVSVSQTNTLNSSTNSVGIGADGAGYFPFAGRIANVAVHNTGLSDEKIRLDALAFFTP